CVWLIVDLPAKSRSARWTRSRRPVRLVLVTNSPNLADRMDDSLYFNDQHHQVREMVRDFSRTHIAPVARELDQTSTFPWDNIKAMGELGLLGVPWGEDLGGAGLDQ